MPPKRVTILPLAQSQDHLAVVVLDQPEYVIPRSAGGSGGASAKARFLSCIELSFQYLPILSHPWKVGLLAALFYSLNRGYHETRSLFRSVVGKHSILMDLRGWDIEPDPEEIKSEVTPAQTMAQVPPIPVEWSNQLKTKRCSRLHRRNIRLKNDQPFGGFKENFRVASFGYPPWQRGVLVICA